jgi:hypothetical protein
MKSMFLGHVINIVNVHNCSTWVSTELLYVLITDNDLYELIY